MLRPLRRPSTLALAASLAVVAPASAQLYPPAPTEGTEFRIQVERPLIEGADFGFLSSVWDLDVALPISDGLGLILGAPVALGTAEDLDASLVLGNLRATLVFGTPERPRGFLGLVAPSATGITDEEYALLLGVLPRLDRIEDWSDDFITLRGGLIRTKDTEASQLGIRLGGAVQALTDFDDANFWLRSGAWIRSQAGAASLHAQLSGGWIINSDDGFGDDSVFYFDAGVDFNEVTGRPGFFIRIPLDENARGPIDVSLGVRVVL